MLWGVAMVAEMQSLQDSLTLHLVDASKAVPEASMLSLAPLHW